MIPSELLYADSGGMIMGSCLEADHRIREYEARVRMQKRVLRDRAVWEKYEQEYEQESGSKKSQ